MWLLFQTTEPKKMHWQTLPEVVHDQIQSLLEQSTENMLYDRYQTFSPLLEILSSLDGMRQSGVEPGTSGKRMQTGPPEGKFAILTGDICRCGGGSHLVVIPDGTILSDSGLAHHDRAPQAQASSNWQELSHLIPLSQSNANRKDYVSLGFTSHSWLSTKDIINNSNIKIMIRITTLRSINILYCRFIDHYRFPHYSITGREPCISLANKLPRRMALPQHTPSLFDTQGHLLWDIEAQRHGESTRVRLFSRGQSLKTTFHLPTNSHSRMGVLSGGSPNELGGWLPQQDEGVVEQFGDDHPIFDQLHLWARPDPEHDWAWISRMEWPQPRPVYPRYCRFTLDEEGALRIHAGEPGFFLSTDPNVLNDQPGIVYSEQLTYDYLDNQMSKLNILIANRGIGFTKVIDRMLAAGDVQAVVGQEVPPENVGELWRWAHLLLLRVPESQAIRWRRELRIAAGRLGVPASELVLPWPTEEHLLPGWNDAQPVPCVRLSPTGQCDPRLGRPSAGSVAGRVAPLITLLLWMTKTDFGLSHGLKGLSRSGLVSLRGPQIAAYEKTLIDRFYRLAAAECSGSAIDCLWAWVDLDEAICSAVHLPLPTRDSWWGAFFERARATRKAIVGRVRASGHSLKIGDLAKFRQPNIIPQFAGESDIAIAGSGPAGDIQRCLRMVVELDGKIARGRVLYNKQ
jgi:hypothetical protein